MIKNTTDTIIKNCKKDKIVYREYIIIDNKKVDIKGNLSDTAYKDTTFFGKFNLKLLKFETENDIDYKQKEFVYYKEIYGEPLKIGTFIVTDVKDSDTFENVNVTAYDYGLKFANPYKTSLNYSSQKITMMDVVKEICNNLNIQLENKSLPNGNFIVDNNPFVNNELYGDVICIIAGDNGTFATVNSDDKLQFLLKTETNEIIEDYVDLDDKRDTKPITCVLIATSEDLKEAGAVKKDANLIQKYGENWLKIYDYAFAYSTEKCQELVNAIFENVKGFGYSSFKSNDSFMPYLTLGDLVKLKNKEGKLIDSIILRYETDYDSVTFEAPSIINASIEYSLAETPENIAKKASIAVNQANGQITLLTKQTDDLNTKTSQLRLDVDKIEGQISDIADITTTVEGTGTLQVDNINESEPIYLKIYPLNKDFSYLYPEDNLYPDEDLYPLTRQILFKNTSEDYQVEYEIPDDLLFYSKDIYDEFILDYDNQACYIIKQVGYQKTKINIEVGNDLSNAYLGLNLNNLQANIIYIQSNNYRIIEKYTSAEDTITLEKLEDSIWNKVDNLYIYNNQTNEVILNLKNYTLPSDFGTVTEIYESRFDNVNDYIQVEKIGNKIPLGTEQRIDYPYPHIPLIAGNYEISLLTQETAYLYVRLMIQNLYTDQFATKVEMNSKITQTANEINAEVSKKVGNDEVISKINLTPETATIQANKVNINGVITAINNDTTTTIDGNKITTGTLNADVINGGTMSGSSINLGNGNFTVDTAGNMKASTGKIGTWDINTVGIFAKDSNNKFSGLRLPQNETKAYSFFAGADSSTGANAKFVAYSDGQLYAQNADIAGRINASSGKISDLNISGGVISNKRMGLDTENGIIRVFNADGGSMILSNAARLSATAGIGISSHSTGTIPAPVSNNLDLKACSGSDAYLGCMIDPDGKIERSGITCRDGILEFRSSGYCTYNGTTIFGSSSKATKENIKDLTESQKAEVYSLIKEIPTKQYDYKKEYGKPFNYGFIIEDIEDTKLKDLLHITQAKNNEDIKMYSTEDLARLQLITIQEMMKKIDILENKVSNLEKQLKNVNIETRKD